MTISSFFSANNSNAIIEVLQNHPGIFEPKEILALQQELISVLSKACEGMNRIINPSPEQLHDLSRDNDWWVSHFGEIHLRFPEIIDEACQALSLCFEKQFNKMKDHDDRMGKALIAVVAVLLPLPVILVFAWACCRSSPARQIASVLTRPCRMLARFWQQPVPPVKERLLYSVQVEEDDLLHNQPK